MDCRFEQLGQIFVLDLKEFLCKERTKGEKNTSQKISSSFMRTIPAIKD